MRKHYWIQNAIKRRGALKQYLKRNRRRIAAATKSPVFKLNGEINITTLRKLRRTQLWQQIPAKRKHEINLAITLHKFHKHK